MAVNGVAVDHGVVVKTGDTFELQARNQRLALRSDDAVTVNVVWHDGALIPGEGVVHVRRSPGLIGGGVVLFCAATALFVAGRASWGTDTSTAAGTMSRMTAEDLMVIAGAAWVGGLTLLAIGLVRRARIDRTGFALVPVVGPSFGGGAAAIRF